MLEEKIKCLLVKPYELPIEIEIDNTLEEKQKLVGGYIEQAFIIKDDSVVSLIPDNKIHISDNKKVINK